jgi:hypothetical protein
MYRTPFCSSYSSYSPLRPYGTKQQKIRTAYETFPTKNVPDTVSFPQRLNMICKNDVFVNAFVNTHIIVEIASADFHKTLDKMLQ